MVIASPKLDPPEYPIAMFRVILNLKTDSIIG